MNKILYTAITDGYDAVHDPPSQEGWTYIMYCDREIKSDVWQLRLIEENIPKINRKIKLLPHHYLPPHDLSIWLDANITFKGDLDTLIAGDLVFWKHTERENVYEEARACIGLGKDRSDIIRAQMIHYENEGFDGKGVVASGLVVRRNTQENRVFNQMWWEELERWSGRDQLSVPYVIHKLGMTCITLPFLRDFEYRAHLKKRRYV